MTGRWVWGPFPAGRVQVTVLGSLVVEATRIASTSSWWARKVIDAVIVWDERDAVCFDATGATITMAAALAIATGDQSRLGDDAGASSPADWPNARALRA